LPQLRLKVIADFELHSQQLTILNIPWTQETEAQSIADSHIGIAPMTDDPWTKGKCGLKLLQYMASGLPVITSPYGVNAEIIEHRKTGLLVENTNQWIEALQTLAHKEARDVMGKEGYKHCAKFYSVATTYQRMEKLLCSFS
jgi:glycosyltransferase involved in cell wall biosynthesis